MKMSEEVTCILSSFSESEKRIYGKKIRELPGGVYLETSKLRFPEHLMTMIHLSYTVCSLLLVAVYFSYQQILQYYLPQCKYIICKSPSRGEKYLCGSAAGKPLICPSYLNDCEKARKWLRVESYLWCNQALRKGLDRELLDLPTKCKKINNGRKIFSDWRVLLHVPETVKKKAYIRLLKAGGATIISAKPPFLTNLKYQITHAFVAKDLINDMRILYRDKFQNMFYPCYISEYLVRGGNLDPKRFYLFPPYYEVLSPKKVKPKVNPPTPSKPKSPVKTPKKSKSLTIKTSAKPSPRRMIIPARKSPTQSSIKDFFPRKRKIEEFHDKAKKKSCLHNFTITFSTPDTRVIKTEDDKTPLFAPSGLKLTQTIQNRPEDISPIFNTETIIISNSDETPEDEPRIIFSKNKFTKSTKKGTTPVVVYLSSDDEKDSRPRKKMKSVIRTPGKCNSDSVVITNVIEPEISKDINCNDVNLADLNEPNKTPGKNVFLETTPQVNDCETPFIEKETVVNAKDDQVQNISKSRLDLTESSDEEQSSSDEEDLNKDNECDTDTMDITEESNKGASFCIKVLEEDAKSDSIANAANDLIQNISELTCSSVESPNEKEIRSDEECLDEIVIDEIDDTDAHVDGAKCSILKERNESDIAFIVKSKQIIADSTEDETNFSKKLESDLAENISELDGNSIESLTQNQLKISKEDPIENVKENIGNKSIKDKDVACKIGSKMSNQVKESDESDISFLLESKKIVKPKVDFIEEKASLNKAESSNHKMSLQCEKENNHIIVFDQNGSTFFEKAQRKTVSAKNQSDMVFKEKSNINSTITEKIKGFTSSENGFNQSEKLISESLNGNNIDGNKLVLVVNDILDEKKSINTFSELTQFEKKLENENKITAFYPKYRTSKIDSFNNDGDKDQSKMITIKRPMKKKMKKIFESGFQRIAIKSQDKKSKFFDRSPFPTRIEGAFEGSNEEKNDKEAMNVVKDYLTSFYHPTSRVIASLLDICKDSKQIYKTSQLHSLLRKIILLHPVRDLMNVYHLSMQKPVENKDNDVIGTITSFDFLRDQVRAVVECFEDEDDISRRKHAKHQLMIVKYIHSMLSNNFGEVLLNNDSITEDKGKGMSRLRGLLIWKMIWPNSSDCSVNSNVKEIVHVTVNLCIETASLELQALTKIIMQILEMIAEICTIRDRIHSRKSYDITCASLVTEVQTVAHKFIFKNDDVKLSTKIWFVDNLKPSWLSSRFIEFLLTSYSSTFISPSNEYLLYKPLSILKIIRCYFFLYPQSSNESLASKKNNNISSRNKSNNSISNTSTDSKNQSALSKTNLKGESKLQVACIRNKPDRVKELIQLGIDPNQKDHAGWTALHEVASYGHVQCLKELLKSPDLDVYVTNDQDDGVTALHDAVMYNHLEAVKLLLQQGGKQLLKMKTHNHKLAIDFAQTEDMRNLLLQESFGTYNYKDINQNIYENVTPLHSSVIEEYLYLLERLISVYTPTKECVVRQSELMNQLELFKEHIFKISDRQTLKIKLYLNSIGKSLNRGYNV